MVIFTKKLGQLKQWTGEKFGSTNKTEKPAELKRLQNETRSRFDGIRNIRDALNTYMKSLDDNRNSSMGELAHAISSQSLFHDENEFGTLLITFGDGISKLSNHQNEFADGIRMGLLMSLEALLNETKEFERLRKKLKNRRLDYDANNNKLQKSKKEDHALEESVKTTKLKYEETLQKLEEMMVQVSRQETELIDPFINFMELQIEHYHQCLKTSESVLGVLKEGKNDLKSIDFIAASFRRELENDDLWGKFEGDSDSEEHEDLKSKKKTEPKKNQEYISAPIKATFSEPENSQPTKTIMIVKANYNFEAENDNEMSLQKGEIIEVTKKIDEGWWIGRSGNKSGMFPANYVSLCEEKQETDKVFEDSEILTLEKVDKSGEFDQRESQSNTIAKPGFSYLPQGAPISFIGRKKGSNSGSSEPAEVEVSATCGECDCEEFTANVFKPGHCNNCFHKH